MYIIFWKAFSSSRTRARGSQLVPAATPRYGAAASRRTAGTADFRPSASVRDHDASWSYVLAFPRVFARGSRISSIKRSSRPYPLQSRNHRGCPVTAAGSRRRRRRWRWRRFYRSHAKHRRACACTTRSACGFRSRISRARHAGSAVRDINSRVLNSLINAHYHRNCDATW